MTAKFPNPCNRCGFCCLIEICPVGLSIIGGPKHRPCPMLQWNGTESACGLITAQTDPQAKAEVEKIIGSGTGCDISAKAVANGVAYDFASLPDETKTALAQRQRAGAILSLHRKK